MMETIHHCRHSPAEAGTSSMGSPFGSNENGVLAAAQPDGGDVLLLPE
jgi:hypothetical protein